MKITWLLKEISLLANIFKKKKVSFCKGLLDVTINVTPNRVHIIQIPCAVLSTGGI